MKTITGTTTAWVTDSRIEYGYDKDNINAYVISDGKMESIGWMRAGVAEVTIHLEDDATLMANLVDALKAEQKQIQAEAQMRVTKIEEKIQSLLCIEFKPEASHV